MEPGTIRVLKIPMAAFLIAALLATGAALYSSAGAAHAEIEGNCTATIAGINVGPLDTGNRDDDIEVSQDSAVTVGALSPAGFQSHKIDLEFGSRRWTVSEDTDDGSQSWSGTVNVDDYAIWGVGLYKVIGTSTLSDGTTCEGAAMVDVGGNPLATVAGASAAAVVAGGTVAAAASGARGALAPFGPLGEMVGESWDAEQGGGREAGQEEEGRGEETRRAPDEARRAEARRTIEDFLWIGPFGCLCFAALALVLTPLMALTGGGAGGPGDPAQPAVAASQAPEPLPRVRWLPRITLLGLVSGLLAGAGVVVLLQQYSIQYPTLGSIITWVIIGMAVYGLVLPTIGQTIRWWRINERIAVLDRSLGGK